VCAIAFLGWMLAPIVGNELVRAEVGYMGAASLLCALLFVVYKSGGAPPTAAAPDPRGG
jgi:hypothetical protein